MKNFLDKYFGTIALVAEFYSILASLDLTLLSIAEDRPCSVFCSIACTCIWCFLYFDELKED